MTFGRARDKTANNRCKWLKRNGQVSCFKLPARGKKSAKWTGKGSASVFHDENAEFRQVKVAICWHLEVYNF